MDAESLKENEIVYFDQNGNRITDQNEINKYLEIASMPPKVEVNIIDVSAL